MSRRDEVIPLRILIDAVDMEIIERRRAITALGVETFICHVGWEMFRGPPLEEQLARGDINLLEESIVEPTKLRAANSTQISRNRVVDGEQRRSFVSDDKFMQVATIEHAHGTNFMALRIGGIEL